MGERKERLRGNSRQTLKERGMNVSVCVVKETRESYFHFRSLHKMQLQQKQHLERGQNMSIIKGMPAPPSIACIRSRIPTRTKGEEEEGENMS